MTRGVNRCTIHSEDRRQKTAEARRDNEDMGKGYVKQKSGRKGSRHGSPCNRDITTLKASSASDRIDVDEARSVKKRLAEIEHSYDLDYRMLKAAYGHVQHDRGVTYIEIGKGDPDAYRRLQKHNARDAKRGRIEGKTLGVERPNGSKPANGFRPDLAKVKHTELQETTQKRIKTSQRRLADGLVANIDVKARQRAERAAERNRRIQDS